MARMYSRKKGQSGSKKPTKKTIQSWMSYKPKEVELLVVKIAKEGKAPSQVGTILRDNYGIPNVKLITKKSISKILGEKKMLHEIPEDLMAVIRKNIMIRKHLEENGQDKVAKRGLQLADSQIMRLVKYYKSAGKLPSDWKYDSEKIRLLVE
ncbi:30S ribosomal protein S15 [Candidatus Woesearchaeota archaeon]|nr:30S ribosomal protein S15 [Candidatus Woesearchaeota archaeon]